jgi:hypothetical protein
MCEKCLRVTELESDRQKDCLKAVARGKDLDGSTLLAGPILHSTRLYPPPPMNVHTYTSTVDYNHGSDNSGTNDDDRYVAPRI